MAASGNGGSAPYGYLPSAQNQGNPLAQVPGTFFHRFGILVRGRRQEIAQTIRTDGGGTLRFWWRGLGNMITGGSAFSWSRNLNDDAPDGVNGVVSSPLRYRIATDYVTTAGNQRSNPEGRQQLRYPTMRHAPNPVFLRAGQQQGRPTIRNRITSFGSRVPPVNQPLPSEKVG
jgi:hypothetical protein